ncbi:MAG: hypothetical protein ACKO9A_06975 [Alphaproteobacteria bacterium]
MRNALSGPNPIPVEFLSGLDRLDEVARILAAGLRRLQAQEASSLSAENRESSFDILALKRRVGRRKPTIRVGES